VAFTDILESLTGAAEAGADRSLLAPLVRQGLTEGLSATQMLDAVRSAGVGLRTQSWYQLVGEVRASAARAEQWSGAALDRLPTPDQVQEWSGGHTETYLNRVYMYVRTSATGELAVERRGVSILTNELITPGDALSMAQDLYAEGDESDNYAGEQLLGAEFGGVYHQLGGG
jgi:hypothetical protein